MDIDPTSSEPKAQAPLGIDHLVLNCRDIEASHRFWCDLLGLRHVGTSRRPRADGLPAMRFYSGERDGRLRHHDLALYQSADAGAGGGQSLDHLAIQYPSEQAWLAQIAFLRANGVEPYRRVERGATHSVHLHDPDGIEVELVFELPREQWQDDIDDALNRAVARPVAG